MTQLFYPDNPEKGSFFHIKGKLVLTGEVQHVPALDKQHEARMVPVVCIYGTGRTGLWTNKVLPQIGARVRVTFNGLGTGTVVAYFREAGYIGVEVRPDKRPDWHIRQNGDRHPHYLVFGAEIEVLP